VHKDWALQARRFVNEVWLNLGYISLSDFCNAAGTHINPYVWKGKQRSRLVQTAVWPATRLPSPTSKAVEQWQVMLNSFFSDPASPTFNTICRPSPLHRSRHWSLRTPFLTAHRHTFNSTCARDNNLIDNSNLEYIYQIRSILRLVMNIRIHCS